MKKIVVLFFIVITILIFIFIAVNNTDSKSQSEISFSSWGSQSEVKIIKSLINDFEKNNPDIKINFIHIPENYSQKIHLLFASNLEPDVVFINNQNIQRYVEAGLIYDLSKDFTNIYDTFFDEAVDCFKHRNGIYAIPRDISNLVIYYNKDILKHSGINIPRKIDSIDQLENIAKKLTSKEHKGINFEEKSLYWLYFLSANGGGVISDDKKSIIINSKQSIEALNIYSDFVNKYHIAPSKSEIGSMTTAQMFINEKIAMYVGGRWMTPKFREVAKFDWDVTEFPSSETNKVYIDSSGWAISQKAKNKELAIKFIKFLSSKESIDEMTRSGLIVPARKDTAYSSVFLDKSNKPKNTAAFINMLKYAKPTPVIKNYPAIDDIINEEAQKVFDSNQNAKDVFNEKLIKKLERLL